MPRTKRVEFSPLYDELLLWTRANLAAILCEFNARQHWTDTAVARWRSGAQRAVREAAKEAVRRAQWVRKVLAGQLPGDFEVFEYGWELEPPTEWPNYPRPKYMRCWTEADRVEARRVVKALGSWRGLGDPPPPGEVGLGPVRLQHPVMRGTTTVGYIDVQAAFHECCLWVMGVTAEQEDECCEVLWTLDCAARWRGGLPTMSELRLPEWSTTVPEWEEDQQTACFLVRPEIPSLAQLLREAQTMRLYAPGHYFVVSLDGRFAEVLQEQEITLVPYPADRQPVAAP